jgi:hypothetical protein
MTLTFQTDAGPLALAPGALIVAGWTGRNLEAVLHHIAELATFGVPAPSTVPLYYRCAPALLTQAEEVAVLGTTTSGEAEPLLIRDAAGELWLGLGSDHTDRGLEAHSVAHAKQVCAKPVARGLWRLDAALTARLDDLALDSDIRDDDAQDWIPYQRGTLAAIQPLAELLAGAPDGLAPGAAMLCGTLAAIGGVRPARQFRARLVDPATGRRLDLSYRAAPLPVIA